MCGYILCFILSMQFRLYAAQLSSSETLLNVTACVGLDSVSIPCDGDEIIAFESVMYFYDDRCAGECCTYSATDATVPDSTEDTEIIRGICSGMSSCIVNLSTAHDFGSGLQSNSYIILQYYCIPKTRVAAICTSKTIQSDGMPLYLTTEDYPGYIDEPIACTCSLEVYSCSSDVIVYTIDIDLQYSTICKHILEFKNGTGSALKSINYGSYYENGIVQDYLNSHYIQVGYGTVDRCYREGRFFVALKASKPSTVFTLSCSSKPESWCTDCGSPVAINHGNITLQVTNTSTYDASANVSCDTGYNTSQAVVTCLFTGTWEEASCEIKDCGSPVEINNGNITLQVANTRTYGASADVSCNPGYDASKEVLHCLETGNWDAATCVIKDCGSPVEINNGSITRQVANTSTYGASAGVSCDAGYDASTTVIKCLETGTWDAATCVIKDCGSPAINNGNIALQVTNTSTYGASADVSCDPGYDASKEAITCLETGTWDAATCVIKDCGSPAINNGNITLQVANTSTYGASADVACDPGYDASKEVINCLHTGTWDSPTCVIKAQLSSSETLLNVTACDGFDSVNIPCYGDEIIAFESLRYFYDIRCASVCCTYIATDATVAGSTVETEIIRRTCSGRSSCNVDLSIPQDFGSGLQSNSYTILQYYCIPKTRVASICSSKTILSAGMPLYLTNEGYPGVTTGDVSCTCSLEVYSCSSDVIVYTVDAALYLDPRDCKQSLVFKNGIGSALKSINCDSYYENGIVQDSLNSHYIQVAFSSVDADNTEGQFFVALKASEPNTTFTLSCSSITESWCTDCGSPVAIYHGNITLQETNTSTFNASANVSCNTGYNTTQAVVTCLFTGTWEEASCEIKDCGSPVEINNGSIALQVANTSTHGASADVSCDPGYDVSKEVIQCLETGTWDAATCVIKAECPSETTDDPTYGIFVWPSTVTGDVSYIKCPHQQSDSSAVKFASRICERYPDNHSGRWIAPIVSQCLPVDETSRELQNIAQTNITNDNVEAVSTRLNNLTSHWQIFESVDVDWSVEAITASLKTNISTTSHTVIGNTFDIINQLLFIEENVLIQSENKFNTSNRLVTAVETMLDRIKVTNGDYKVMKDNIAGFVVGVDGSDFDGLSMSYIGAGNKALTNSPTIAQTNEFKSLPVEGGDAVPAERKINSNVIAASVPTLDIKDLNDPVVVTLQHFNRGENVSCVYWDSVGLRWSVDGCSVNLTTDHYTVCHCDHLTNFALLMDVYGSVDSADALALQIISYVGCGLSLIGVILTLVTYLKFRKLRRGNPSVILMNLCVAIGLVDLVFLAGEQEYAAVSVVGCKVVAVLLHYFLLSVMCWMSVEAFTIYLALVKVFDTYVARFQLKSTLFGWALPIVVVVITLGVNSSDNYGLQSGGICWLGRVPFYAAFLGPVCLLLIINAIIYVLAIRKIVNRSGNTLPKTDKPSTAVRLRGAISLLFLLGLTWAFAFLAVDKFGIVFHYLFAVFNSLQGFFIFIFHCLWRKEARTCWSKEIQCLTSPYEKDMSTTYSKGGSSTDASSTPATKQSSSSISAKCDDKEQ